MPLIFRNGSSYDTVQYEYDFNFFDCYVIWMDLRYSEGYAPTAAFFSHVVQLVVLDQDFEPVLIGIESSKAVA